VKVWPILIKWSPQRRSPKRPAICGSSRAAFGCNGFTSTFKQFDFKSGGEWTYTFHGPNGIDYSNYCVFIEIVPDESIVYDHLSLLNFRMTMTFTDEGGGTRFVWRMAFATVAHCGQLSHICVPANEENFDRLEAHLAAMI